MATRPIAPTQTPRSSITCFVRYLWLNLNSTLTFSYSRAIHMPPLSPFGVCCVNAAHLSINTHKATLSTYVYGKTKICVTTMMV